MLTREPDIVDVCVPSSKSVSHRLLICAALAPGMSMLERVADCDDTRRTMDVLRKAGASFEDVSVSADSLNLCVTGVARAAATGDDEPADCFVGESGSTCRFLTPVLAALGGRYRVHGAGRMDRRPVAKLLDALRAQGVEFAFEGAAGHTPFVMMSRGLRGGTIEIDTSETNQFLSGLLLALPAAGSAVTVQPTGGRVASWSYVPLTLAAMKSFGVSVKVFVRGDEGDAFTLDTAPRPADLRFVLSGDGYRAASAECAGDWSAASYFLAAGALGPVGTRTLRARRDSLQGDRVIADILQEMRARVTWDEDSVTVLPPRVGALCGIERDMSMCPDIVPTVALAAVFASTPTRLTGIGHLRLKECDRAAALETELTKLGARVTLTADSLTVEPTPDRAALRGAEVTFASYGDHRMVMALTLAETVGVRARFDNTHCVAKSFPNFMNEWSKVRAALDAAGELL